MKNFIIENTWLPRGSFDFGWGNGYVLIPKGHKLFGVDYNDIDVNVHGGLTYSQEITADHIERLGLEVEDIGMWCVGFDTAHYQDTLSEWSKEKVQEEANKLMNQLESI